jgi:hypothetical protein
MKFSSTFFAFSLIALVVSSPMPAKGDKDSEKNSDKGQTKAAARLQFWLEDTYEPVEHVIAVLKTLL